MLTLSHGMIDWRAENAPFPAPIASENNSSTLTWEPWVQIPARTVIFSQFICESSFKGHHELYGQTCINLRSNSLECVNSSILIGPAWELLHFEMTGSSIGVTIDWKLMYIMMHRFWKTKKVYIILSSRGKRQRLCTVQPRLRYDILFSY